MNHPAMQGLTLNTPSYVKNAKLMAWVADKARWHVRRVDGLGELSVKPVNLRRVDGRGSAAEQMGCQVKRFDGLGELSVKSANLQV